MKKIIKNLGSMTLMLCMFLGFANVVNATPIPEKSDAYEVKEGSLIIENASWDNNLWSIKQETKDGRTRWSTTPKTVSPIEIKVDGNESAYINTDIGTNEINLKLIGVSTNGNKLSSNKENKPTFNIENGIVNLEVVGDISMSTTTGDAAVIKIGSDAALNLNSSEYLEVLGKGVHSAIESSGNVTIERGNYHFDAYIDDIIDIPDGKLNINGGNVKIGDDNEIANYVSLEPVYGGSYLEEKPKLYPVEIILDGITETTTVDNIKISCYNQSIYYETRDIKTIRNKDTNEEELYFWLKDGDVISEITIDGELYKGYMSRDTSKEFRKVVFRKVEYKYNYNLEDGSIYAETYREQGSEKYDKMLITQDKNTYLVKLENEITITGGTKENPTSNNIYIENYYYTSIKLILDNVHIDSSKEESPLYIRGGSADITLKGENTLKDSMPMQKQAMEKYACYGINAQGTNLKIHGTKEDSLKAEAEVARRNAGIYCGSLEVENITLTAIAKGAFQEDSIGIVCEYGYKNFRGRIIEEDTRKVHVINANVIVKSGNAIRSMGIGTDEFILDGGSVDVETGELSVDISGMICNEVIINSGDLKVKINSICLPSREHGGIISDAGFTMNGGKVDIICDSNFTGEIPKEYIDIYDNEDSDYKAVLFALSAEGSNIIINNGQLNIGMKEDNRMILVPVFAEVINIVGDSKVEAKLNQENILAGAIISRAPFADEAILVPKYNEEDEYRNKGSEIEYKSHIDKELLGRYKLPQLPNVEGMAYSITFNDVPSNYVKLGKVEYDGGNGDSYTESYVINTLDQFIKFANEINDGNTYENKFFKLGADIDLDIFNKWNPIGNSDEDQADYTFARTAFEGYFDGCAHSILNAKIGKEKTYWYQGLFGTIGQKGVITRLGVQATVKGNSYLGIIAGANEGIIKNCYTKKGSSIDGKLFMGGITGYNQGQVLNCYNNANIISYNDEESLLAHTGGIAGSGNIIKNCYNLGEVTFITGNPTTWGEISPSTSGTMYCYYDVVDEADNGSGAGTALTETDMKSTLANTLNKNLSEIKDETLYMWEQTDGQYPVLTNKPWVAVKGIKVTSKDDIIRIKLGESLQMMAKVMPEDAIDKSYTWKVINITGSATISESGVLTPTKEGAVTVRAISNSDELVFDDMLITIIKPVLKTPEINLEEGRYTTKQLVTINSEEGSEIYYSIDFFGKKPTIRDVKYTKPIELDMSAKVHVYATKENYRNSNVAIKTYTIQIPKVNGVPIEGYPKTLKRGINHIINLEFSYSLDYEYLNSSQVGITWSIESEHTKDTYIKEGKIFVGEKESATELKIRATSDFDNTKYSEVTIGLTNPNYISAGKVSNIEGVINGTAIENVVLPNVIKITTDVKDNYVAIVWDKENVEYDKENKEAQTIKVKGLIKLGEYIDNLENKNLEVEIEINVLGQAETPEIEKGGVSGKVTNNNEEVMKDIIVKLVKGGTDNGTLIQETHTDEEGRYTFVNIPDGVYSLVAINGEQTITKTVVINNQKIEQDLKLPDPKLDTKLEIVGSKVSVAVDNLEEVANANGHNVEIRLIVEKKEEEKAEGQEEIKKGLTSEEKVGTYLDARLTKSEDGKEAENIQPQKGSTVKITIDLPEELWGKKSYSIVRYHEGKAEKIVSIYDEKLHTLTFETDRFSTYAIVYKEETKEETSSGSSSNHTTYQSLARYEKELYKDVSKEDWYYEAVKYMSENELMCGTSKDKFSPHMTTSRAMFITVLWRLENKPEVTSNYTFKDLEENAYYEEAVKWGVKNKLIKGYSKEEFVPERAITREQAAAILYRYEEFKKVKTTAKADLSKYEDANKISNYAKEAMNWAISDNILVGKENRLDPTVAAERCEFATMLYRIIK